MKKSEVKKSEVKKSEVEKSEVEKSEVEKLEIRSGNLGVEKIWRFDVVNEKGEITREAQTTTKPNNVSAANK